MLVTHLLGKLQNTQYRSLCSQTRMAINFIESNWTVYSDMKSSIAFFIEYGLYKYSIDGIMQILWTLNQEHRDLNGTLLTLERYFQEDCKNANLTSHMDLLPFTKVWDSITSSFHTSDYSLYDMGEQGMVFKTFSEETILRGIKECKPGKPLNYFKKCLEAIRSESIKDLRKDELQMTLVASSSPLVLPTYRKPGLVSMACEEDDFLNAL